jgi:hypothetical protein
MWGIVEIAGGGKLDGMGYGSKIHDRHGSECCEEAVWVRGKVDTGTGEVEKKKIGRIKKVVVKKVVRKVKKKQITWIKKVAVKKVVRKARRKNMKSTEEKLKALIKELKSSKSSKMKK